MPEKLKELATSLEEIKKFKSQTDESKQEGLAKLARELLDDIRFLFKADHYKEEQEVRVVEMRYSWKDGTQALDQIQVDTEQIPPRFYLETSKDFRFSEVILGPQSAWCA